MGDSKLAASWWGSRELMGVARWKTSTASVGRRMPEKSKVRMKRYVYMPML